MVGRDAEDEGVDAVAEDGAVSEAAETRGAAVETELQEARRQDDVVAGAVCCIGRCLWSAMGFVSRVLEAGEEISGAFAAI